MIAISGVKHGFGDVAMIKYCTLKTLQTHKIIIFLIISGFVLRAYTLGVSSFWLDEAISSIVSVAIFEHGSPVFPSGQMYTRSILHTFLMAISFKLFGINEFAARLPSVLFGTMTILLIYLVGSKWGNRRIGIIAAALVAFSVCEIAWSRQARMYQQLQFFYLLSLYLFYEFMNNKSLKRFELLVFSVIGTLLSHVFGYALLVVFLMYIIISALEKPGSIKDGQRRVIIIAAFVFATLFAFMYNKGVVQTVLNTEVNYYNIYILFLKKDLGIFLFFAVAGGAVLLDKDWKKGLLLIVAIIFPLYIIFFHTYLFATRYFFFVIPILFILAGYLFDGIITRLSSVFTKIRDLLTRRIYQINPEKNRRIRQTAICIIVAVFLISTMYFSPAYTFLPKEKYDLGPNAPQADFKKAYMYVKDHMQPDDAIVSTWTPPAQFYLGKSDYWLVFNLAGTGMEGSLMDNSTREVYTNATTILDTEDLIKVVDEHEGGWVVVDRVSWKRLSPGIKNFINSNLTFYQSSGNAKLYGWKRNA